MIGSRITLYQYWLKPLLDGCVAIILIIVTLPLQLLIALVLACLLGPRHILFCQRRIGYKGQPFTIIKFTSLRPVAPDKLLEVDPQRAFLFGNFLRSSVLDELPQLYQILFGQMSFVGPRPLLPDYLAYYTPQQRLRHSVRPGITGKAQIAGANELPFEERFTLDLDYVQKISFKEDCSVLFGSFRYLFRLSSSAKQTPVWSPAKPDQN